MARVNPLLAFAINALLPQIKTQGVSTTTPELMDLPCVQSLRSKAGSVVFILGKRESGKSVAAYRLAEILGRPTYAVSPEQTPPSWVTEITLEDVAEQPPQFSTLILDDIPVYAGQHDYNNPLVRVVEQLIPVVRHRRKLHLIFCSQSSALSDRYVLTADMIGFKQASLLFLETERPQVAKVYKAVNPVFEAMSIADRKKHLYILSEDWRGMAKVRLPGML